MKSLPRSPSLLAAIILGTLALNARAADTAVAPMGEGAPMHRVYSHLLDPREHPDYDRRTVQPPSWDTFGNQTQFACLRGFGVEGDQIVGYAEELEKWTKTFDLGRIVWPSYPIIFARNLGDLADEVKRRDLFLFDIWGYVPGSGPGGYWTQFKPPADVFDMLTSKLGDHWLGMDVGEQDGRYVGGYASQMYPVSGDRFEQYLNFQRHFEFMCDELGNRTSALVSLNFGHYFLKEGVYTTIGAETAQALPNSQVYYAFIRGAGKQYGVPWFGNASVWNRWGYKTYGDSAADHGPTKGTSLNLLKRLMYNHILYNCVFVGFESSWFDGEALSPVGRIQQSAQQWVRQNGQPGVNTTPVMLTPVALITDFFSGWSFPRHLYSGNVYRVWGNVPYDPGDYLTDGLIDMFYPGYQDASYFHNEFGFMTATPYGDSADCLLSDAPRWLLERYPVLVLAGELAGDTELRDKLALYAERGGHLVLSAGNLARFTEPLAGFSVAGVPRRLEPAPTVRVGESDLAEERPLELYPLTVPAEARVLAQCGGMPAAVEAPCGAGVVTVLASPFGVAAASAVEGGIPNGEEQRLLKPFPLLNHVRAVLESVFKKQMLFEVGEGLSLVTCRKAPGEYTLAITNNGLEARPFQVVSHCGPIESLTELALDQSEKGAPGYLPEGFEDTAIGTSGAEVIAGGDVRVFAVKVTEQQVAEIPHVAPAPRPRARALPLRGHRSIKEQVLARPTFFEHYDGVSIDWRYLHDRDKAAIEKEAAWIRRQGLRVFVDLTSGINLYPDLRLVNNSEQDYAASMAAIANVLDKMSTLGSRDLILCLHRVPENNTSGEQTYESFVETLRNVCSQAAAVNVTVYIRTSVKAVASVDDAMGIVDRVAAPNLMLAPSTALLLHHNADPNAVTARANGKVGLWLLSAPGYDIAGALWTTNNAIASHDARERLLQYCASAPDIPVLFDAVYDSQDEEYLDVRALK